MSRRCKSGIRARIIGKCSNAGRIVLVVRPYFYPEEVLGSAWPEEILHPWVVTSLGAPLRCFDAESEEECPPQMTIVVEDADLEPLDDNEDGLTLTDDRETPISSPKPALAESTSENLS
jgi:hypothetical protein